MPYFFLAVIIFAETPDLRTARNYLARSSLGMSSTCYQTGRVMERMESKVSMLPSTYGMFTFPGLSKKTQWRSDAHCTPRMKNMGNQSQVAPVLMTQLLRPNRCLFAAISSIFEIKLYNQSTVNLRI